MNYRTLAILSSLIFGQMQAMEDDNVSRLMPEINLRDDAKELIRLSGNSNPHFTCMYKPYDPALSPRTNEQIQTLNDLLDKDGNPYNELKPEDLRKAAEDSTILQAWLYLLRGKKRDDVIERYFIEMLEKDNYFSITWFKNNNLQVDGFDPGFLETLAKIAEFKAKSHIKDSLLDLVRDSAKKMAQKESDQTEKTRHQPFGGGGFIDSL